jgi:hypothetical protein
MSRKFKVEGIGTWTKDLGIVAPDNCCLAIQVDYDDVNHDDVDKDVRKLVKILNEHWND